VATGRVPMSHSIEKSWSYSVVSVTENISVAEAQLVMLNTMSHTLRYAVVLINRNKGIISTDLVVAQNNSPEY
jgi:CBS domain-containing protein